MESDGMCDHVPMGELSSTLSGELLPPVLTRER